MAYLVSLEAKDRQALPVLQGLLVASFLQDLFLRVLSHQDLSLQDLQVCSCVVRVLFCPLKCEHRKITVL